MSGTPGSDRSSAPRPRDLYLAAAVLPLVPAAASIVTGIGGDWTAMSAALVRDVTRDALLYSAVCSVVAAPLAGVAVAGRAAGGHTLPVRDATRRLMVATAVFTGVSAILTVVRLGVDAEALRLVATSHAVLASATLALTALGAGLATRVRDPLDAAAVSLTVAVAAAYGVLVGGTSVGEMPAPLLKAALLVSPVMTVAAAAHVDLVRSEIWYQISPLAHVQLEYPAWTTACGWYMLAGAGLFATLWGAGHHPARERGHGF